MATHSRTEHINLFEYRNSQRIDSSAEKTIATLEKTLQEIWESRKDYQGFAAPSEHWRGDSETADTKQTQRLLRIVCPKDRDCEIRATNFIGVLRFKGESANTFTQINLLPKIFFSEKQQAQSLSPEHISGIQKHILWWLSYCSSFRVPRFAADLSAERANFFELLVYFFASYTSELFSQGLYAYFEEVEGELSFVKGRIHTSAYLRENIARGRWQYVHCVYDSVLVDNRFNQIVKNVAQMLYDWSSDAENRRLLAEILFFLDDVSTLPARAEDCRSIRFNTFLEEYETVRDYCELFLDSALSYHYKDDLRLFAFLLPAERVFEEFIAGFMQRHARFLKIDVRSQCTSHLVSSYFDVNAEVHNKGVFQIRPDICIKTQSEGNTADSRIHQHQQEEREAILADTKYKVIDLWHASEPQKGIAQSDLYQMLAYATRFGVQQVFLLYPMTLQQCEAYRASQNTAENTAVMSHTFIIKPKKHEPEQIRITAATVPIIEPEFLQPNFEAAENRLKQYLKELL